ncbi:glycosyl transferase [Deferribacter desulfuricans SSM1]|uniref:Glycosyl transferase n=1 Tax=Deferribacter desulfuricans (strain DSM 14783 / JCM 11476 / NBRC 101012 / SSM1) TaxID=639282 RepID=D3PB60_DEFDS|nr:glycosyltransferase family 4 protein [Deferribacter desulfuricans]BAI79833.1 glycosyl transferase [Deferribacter desulfuricans SSM1]
MGRKIVLFIRTFSKYGGVENFCYRFYHFLVEKGYEVKVVCGENKTDIKNDSVIEFGLWRPGRFLKTFSYYLKASKIAKNNDNSLNIALTKVNFCHVIRSGSGSHLDFLINSLRGYRGYSKLKKIIKRLFSPVNYLTVFIEKKMYRDNPNLKLVVFQSNMAKKEFLNRYNLTNLNYKIIPNSVNKNIFKLMYDDYNSFYEKYSLSKDKIYVGFAASNFELKGLIYLIDAIKYLPDNVELLIAGNRNPKKYIEKAKKLKIEDRVHFLGKVENMNDFYNVLNVFCLPTFYDTCANVVLESLAAGTPVITTTNNGAQDFVLDGKNGFLLSVDELSGAKLADLIVKAIKINKYDVIRYSRLYTDGEIFNQYLEGIKGII